MIKTILIILLSLGLSIGQECDSGYTYFDNVPINTTVLQGDNCFADTEIHFLNELLNDNNSLDFDSPLEIGTQNWMNGHLLFFYLGNTSTGGGIAIDILPESIENLSSLRILYLDFNNLNELPESIGNLTQLIYFVLSFNQLTEIPESIGNLTNLSWIDLGYNQLESLPESIGNLTDLTYFWIFGNNLTDLPDSFCNLSIENGGSLDMYNDDYELIPYFGSGGNSLCEDIPECIVDSPNFNIALDQAYYSFQVTLEQECEDGCNPGDLNEDEDYNILDVVALVNYVLSSNMDNDCAADFNQDEVVNILDIVQLVNFVLD